jgi:hypothetical protein
MKTSDKRCCNLSASVQEDKLVDAASPNPGPAARSFACALTLGFDWFWARQTLDRSCIDRRKWPCSAFEV